MCKHPLKGFPVGRTENNKTKFIVTSYKVHHLEKVNGLWTKCYDEFISPSRDYVVDFTELPCGRCIDCRLEYSRQWANRMMLELQQYDENTCWFLTLTYDDEHLPIVGFPDPDVVQGTLVPDDMTLFLKRLRDSERYHKDNKFRYFYCGEYGSNGTRRPHYHAIMFNLPLDDLVLFGFSKTGYPLYNSDYITKKWGNGFVTVSPVSWDTCAYTARYVLKKQAKTAEDKDLLEFYGVAPEFVRMSRKPGIGAAAYRKEMFDYDYINLRTSDGGIQIKPPRFYEKMLGEEDPIRLEDIKMNRLENAQARRYLKMSQTDLTWSQLLEVEEKQLENRIKSLKRDKV